MHTACDDRMCMVLVCWFRGIGTVALCCPAVAIWNNASSKMLRRIRSETRLGFLFWDLVWLEGMFGKLRKASGGRLSSVSLAAQEAYDGGLINYTVSKQLYRRSKSVKQALSSTLKSARTTPTFHHTYTHTYVHTYQ